MKISKLLLISISCFLIVPAIMAQAANGQAESDQSRSGILGYLNPRTGTFHRLAKPNSITAEPPALTTFTGTINLTITITLKSTGITNINCFAITSVSDGSGAVKSSFGELDAVPATGTGSTRTCALSIPYSWNLATQSTDIMQTSYEVGNVPLVLVTPPTPPDRNSILTPVDSRKVPANGTITSLTANVTI